MRKAQIAQTIELRQSTIKDYLNCPLMFRYRHIEKVPPNWRNPAALHGSTLHKLIFLIHDSKWNMNVRHYYREVFEYYEQHHADAAIPVFWKEPREKMLQEFEDNAAEILDGYRNNPANRQAIVLYAEQEFRVKIHGYWFTGTLDQVRRNADGTTELIDFKSNKNQPTIPFLYNDWQLSLYLYAVKYGELKVSGEWEKARLLPTYSSWYFLRGHEVRKRSTGNGKAGEEKMENPLIRTEKGLPELRGFRNDTKQLLKVILQDSHFPNPNSCSICPFTQLCMERHNVIPTSIINQAKQLLQEVE